MLQNEAVKMFDKALEITQSISLDQLLQNLSSTSSSKYFCLLNIVSHGSCLYGVGSESHCGQGLYLAQSFSNGSASNILEVLENFQ